MIVQELKIKILATNYFIDNEYLDKYCELIFNNLERRREKYKTQRHHIIPQYYFKLNNLEVDNSKENLVNLLYKDHLLSHYYLVLCSKAEIYNKLSFSFIIMTAHKEKLEGFDPTKLNDYQKLYEECCKETSRLNSGRKRGPEYGAKMSMINSGRTRSPATRQLISLHSKGIKKPTTSQKLKGKPNKSRGCKRSEETKNKMSEAKKGKPLSPEHKQALKGSHKKGSGGRPKGCKNHPGTINKNKKLFTQKEIELIISYYLNGKSLSEVGKLFNVSYDIIYRVLKENNIPRRSTSENRKFLKNGKATTTKETILNSFKLYFNKDLTQIDIHNITGIGMEVFRLKLIEYGIQLKDKRYKVCGILEKYKIYDSNIQNLDEFVSYIKILFKENNIIV